MPSRRTQLAIVVGELFRPTPVLALAGQATLLEVLQVRIAEQLASLGAVGLTARGESSTGRRDVRPRSWRETLTDHLVREIMFRGSRGGPLAPLADQLNHDVTHLQGQRLEGMLAQLADQVRKLAAGGQRYGDAEKAGATAAAAGVPGGPGGSARRTGFPANRRR